MRALYLYNDWARAILSLGWIPLLVSLSPQLRARLLGPFKSDLLADAGLKDFKEEYWYSGSRVIDQDGKERFLAEAIRQIAGNMVLIGESGLGKTTFLRLLATRSRGALVFLNATSCDKGVLEAIVRKTKEFQNINFFRYLTETRDLSIIVDGLNEVSADVRAIIVKFANDFRNSNILISTQPIKSVTAKRSSFDNATFYELCPLNRDDIKGFLISRPRSGGGGRAGQSCSYRRAVRQFLSSELDSARTVEERQAAQLILSNPMDLTYASELLSLGTIPRPTGMIGQAFRLARADYESYSKIDFPASKFADKTVEMRNENRNWLYEDEFSNVQKALERFRLMVRRSVRGRDGKETTGLIFRHDKVWDFFMQIAFAANEEFQVTYMDDPRFRGVYLLFAQSADVLTARRLRDLVVHRAAETQDHTLSDEFVRRLAVRDPDSYPNRPSTGTQQKAGSRKEDDETGSLPRN